MKKSKILLSLLALILCAALPLYIIAPSIFINSDITAGSIGGKIPYLDVIKNENNIINTGFDSSDSRKSGTNTRNFVFVSGRPIGIKLYCDGVMVVGTEKIKTEDGYVNPAAAAGIKTGDIILSVNGEKVSSNAMFSSVINGSGGKELTFVLKREGEEIKVKFKTVYSPDDNRYKAGLWIRDSSAGIGILTLITENMQFASLGHGVCDADTGDIFTVSGGEINEAEITAVSKGEKGAAGELRGALEKEAIGKVICNEIRGVYGIYDKNRFNSNEYKVYPVAHANEVTTGDVQILTTVENGVTKLYNAEITKIENKNDSSKDFVLKITDNELILKTGGIVQGMSGSPIIQNGRLAGAVTHVFVNDPTGGYGIYAEKMLERAAEIK